MNVPALLEHGPAGLAALVVLVVVGFVYRMAKLQADSYLKTTEALTKEVADTRGLFTENASASREVIRELSVANREERKELAAERQDMGERIERVADRSAEVAVSMTEALSRVCSRMEERPCLMGSRLANSGEDQAQGENGPPEGE